MAIEPISGKPLNLALPAKSATKESAVTQQPASSSGNVDSIDSSHTSADFKAVTLTGVSVPVVNENRVAALKSAIQAGEYQPNPERIASKLLQFDNQLPNST